MATKEPPRTKVDPHLYEPDPDPKMVEYLPPSLRRKRKPRRYCNHCKLPGEPGDDRHPLDALPPLDPAWREHDEAVLGERETTPDHLSRLEEA